MLIAPKCGEHTGRKFVLDLAFVVRCTVAATAAYMLANAMGMDRPGWASVSALIVSQEGLRETAWASIWRVVGTLLGVLSAMFATRLLQDTGTPIGIELGLAVAICAIIARKYPKVRVCMWTVPIVFLTSIPEITPIHDGLWRGTEVLTGVLVGTAIHAFFAMLLLPILDSTDKPDTRGHKGTA